MSSHATASHSRLDLFSGGLSIRSIRLSPGEMVAIAAAIAVIGLVFFYYLSSLKPARLELQAAKGRFDRQQEVLAADALSQGSPEISRAEQIQRAKESLEHFKTKRLKPLDPGRSSIFEEINALVRKNNVQLTSGIEMSSGNVLAGEKKKDLEDMLDVFPKRHVQFTVVGSYPNLRALISSLEGSEQFITVDTISLASVDEAEAGRATRRRAAPGGSSVSLTIGVTAYYRV